MKNIFIYSYSTKSKFPNLKNLTPWTKILNNFGCMAVSDIQEAYKVACENFNSDNLCKLIDLIDTYFKESRYTKIKTVSEIIGKTPYKRITIEYENNGGDTYVDYFLIDDDMQ